MDRYYTPEPLARNLLERCSFWESAAHVADPSCGGGALLSAAEAVLGAQTCVGIDLDRATIRSLRRSKPHWRLSVADLLCERSVRRSLVGKNELVPNLLLLNPPFSQDGRKYVQFQQSNGEIVRVSRAMQFILQSVELFKPTAGVFAIVPESLIYSELDAHARSLVNLQFEMREVDAIKTTAFRGARVRSVAIELRRCSSRQELAQTRPVTALTVQLERGSLPVHLAVPCKRGALFVHSTDLLPLVEKCASTFNVEPGRSECKGWVLLLPRVGSPKRDAFKAVEITRPIRLSDCVMALWCQDHAAAEFVEQTVLKNWESFTNMYRGTGARYLTVERLKYWLADNGIKAVTRSQ